MNSSYKFDFIQSQSYPVIEIRIKLVYLIKTQFLHTEIVCDFDKFSNKDKN